MSPPSANYCLKYLVFFLWLAILVAIGNDLGYVQPKPAGLD